MKPETIHELCKILCNDDPFMDRWSEFYESLKARDPSVRVSGRKFESGLTSAYDHVRIILTVWDAQNSSTTVDKIAEIVESMKFERLAGDIRNKLLAPENRKDSLANKKLFTKICQAMSSSMTIVRDWKKLYHSLDYEDPELFITVQNFEKGHKTAYDLISEILHGWVSRVGTGKASVKELERVVRELGYNACADEILELAAKEGEGKSALS